MSHKQNQPPLGLGTSDADWEQSIVTAEELPVNVNSKTASQVFGSHGEDRLKALARLMMVSFTWSMAELSQRK
ncbi:MAG: hypothetical protein P2A85_22235 [Microcoleus anatoxicus]|uniref:hypothetical protein n=1 Tax=Microcoleus anatoxicus TaxID=2705319 RepID=UPI00366F036E